MPKYLDFSGLGRLVQKIKTLLAGKANEADVVNLAANQIISGKKTFNQMGINGNIEMPIANKRNGEYFIRFNLDNMPANAEMDLLRTHYAGRKLALSAKRGASGDPYYRIGGNIRFDNTVKFIGNGSILQIASENGQRAAQYLEFLKGNTRLGIFGLASSTDDDITLESSGNNSLFLIAQHLRLSARDRIYLRSVVEFGPDIRMGHSSRFARISPEDNSRKELRFNRADQNNPQAIFDLNLENISRIFGLPTPTGDNEAANKAYVDALKTQIKNIAAQSADFAAFKAAIANL